MDQPAEAPPLYHRWWRRVIISILLGLATTTTIAMAMIVTESASGLDWSIFTIEVVSVDGLCIYGTDRDDLGAWRMGRDIYGLPLEVLRVTHGSFGAPHRAEFSLFGIVLDTGLFSIPFLGFFVLPLVSSNSSTPARLREGRCMSCGYDLRGTVDGIRCPECGLACSEEIRLKVQRELKRIRESSASVIAYGILCGALVAICTPLACVVRQNYLVPGLEDPYWYTNGNDAGYDHLAVHLPVVLYVLFNVAMLVGIRKSHMLHSFPGTGRWRAAGLLIVGGLAGWLLWLVVRSIAYFD